MSSMFVMLNFKAFSIIKGVSIFQGKIGASGFSLEEWSKTLPGAEKCRKFGNIGNKGKI